MSEPYQLKIAPGAEKDIKKFKKSGNQALKKLVEEILMRPKLKGRPLCKPLSGLWRAKAPPFRIIYRINEKKRIVEILRIENRDSAYDGLEDLLDE
jgi:mRNA interferase RelE/StbE